MSEFDNTATSSPFPDINCGATYDQFMSKINSQQFLKNKIIY